jgi:hypothetical protein
MRLRLLSALALVLVAGLLLVVVLPLFLLQPPSFAGCDLDTAPDTRRHGAEGRVDDREREQGRNRVLPPALACERFEGGIVLAHLFGSHGLSIVWRIS